MNSRTRYTISIDEVKEILSQHIDSKTDNQVFVNPKDIHFDIRVCDQTGWYVRNIYFDLEEDIDI